MFLVWSLAVKSTWRYVAFSYSAWACCFYFLMEAVNVVIGAWRFMVCCCFVHRDAHRVDAADRRIKLMCTRVSPGCCCVCGDIWVFICFTCDGVWWRVKLHHLFLFLSWCVLLYSYCLHLLILFLGNCCCCCSCYHRQ